MQFALLGEIQFELITYFDGLEGRFGSDYAEHALIEGKPRIQWIGDKLDEWTLKLKFHQLYCDPELEVARLQDALEMHEPLPFVLATGEYKGEFVVTEISVTSEQTDLIGTLVSVEASVSLKEHVPPPGVGRVSFETPAVQAPGKPPAPQVEKVVAGAESTKAPLAEARQALGQAVGHRQVGAFGHSVVDHVGRRRHAGLRRHEDHPAPTLLDHARHIMARQAHAGDHIDLIEARPLTVRRVEEIHIVKDAEVVDQDIGARFGSE